MPRSLKERVGFSPSCLTKRRVEAELLPELDAAVEVRRPLGLADDLRRRERREDVLAVAPDAAPLERGGLPVRERAPAPVEEVAPLPSRQAERGEVVEDLEEAAAGGALGEDLLDAVGGAAAEAGEAGEGRRHCGAPTPPAPLAARRRGCSRRPRRRGRGRPSRPPSRSSRGRAPPRRGRGSSGRRRRAPSRGRPPSSSRRSPRPSPGRGRGGAARRSGRSASTSRRPRGRRGGGRRRGRPRAAAWRVASESGISRGRTRRASLVSSSASGWTRTRRRPGGTGSEIGGTKSAGSDDGTRTRPPRIEANPLSPCQEPSAACSPLRTASRRTRFRVSPRRSAAAFAPAAAEAAEEPRPLARGSPFSSESSMPVRGVARPAAIAASRTWAAATEAVFFSASRGSRPWSPVISTILTPGFFDRQAVTVSPGPSRAAPRTSNPGPRFATLAGAKARTRALTAPPPRGAPSRRPRGPSRRRRRRCCTPRSPVRSIPRSLPRARWR